jgi:hypothetical protein
VLRFLKAADNPELPLQKLEVEWQAVKRKADRGQIFFSPADTIVDEDVSKCNESFILWGKVQKGQESCCPAGCDLPAKSELLLLDERHM